MGYPGINLIRPHELVLIWQEKQILHKFRVVWEFIVTIVMLLQLRALGVPTYIIGLKAEVKKTLNISALSVTISEVTILTN